MSFASRITEFEPAALAAVGPTAYEIHQAAAEQAMRLGVSIEEAKGIKAAAAAYQDAADHMIIILADSQAEDPVTSIDYCGLIGSVARSGSMKPYLRLVPQDEGAHIPKSREKCASTFAYYRSLEAWATIATDADNGDIEPGALAGAALVAAETISAIEGNILSQTTREAEAIIEEASILLRGEDQLNRVVEVFDEADAEKRRALARKAMLATTTGDVDILLREGLGRRKASHRIIDSLRSLVPVLS